MSDEDLFESLIKIETLADSYAASARALEKLAQKLKGTAMMHDRIAKGLSGNTLKGVRVFTLLNRESTGVEARNLPVELQMEIAGMVQRYYLGEAQKIVAAIDELKEKI